MEGVTYIEPPSIKNAMKAMHVLLCRQSFEGPDTMDLLFVHFNHFAVQYEMHVLHLEIIQILNQHSVEKTIPGDAMKKLEMFA